MLKGAASTALGAGIIFADAYFNVGINEYTKHIPESLCAVGGLIHTIRNFSLLLDTWDYGNEIDSAINAHMRSGPKIVV
jgi:hypothetical protein